MLQVSRERHKNWPYCATVDRPYLLPLWSCSDDVPRNCRGEIARWMPTEYLLHIQRTSYHSPLLRDPVASKRFNALIVIRFNKHPLRKSSRLLTFLNTVLKYISRKKSVTLREWQPHTQKWVGPSTPIPSGCASNFYPVSTQITSVRSFAGANGNFSAQLFPILALC